MRVLVVGGAGYIGSHVALLLAEHGHTVTVYDDLSQGHAAALGVARGARVAGSSTLERGAQDQATAGGDAGGAARPSSALRLERGDVRDRRHLAELLRRTGCEAVLHFAALTQVGESIARPLDYYDVNVGGTLALLGAMAEAGVGRLVFSSSAAVYGSPAQTPIPEDAPLAPTNPYGETKAAMEAAMRWAAAALHIGPRPAGLRYVALRYFNAAGAHPSGALGEDHRPESHLIPLVLQVALGQRERVAIYGADYPTPDGTCVRDYIHVQDLAEAHLAALEYLVAGGASIACNLGNGQGYSVQQVLATCRQVTGHAIPAELVARRPGDPPVLVASAERARQLLGWRPQRPELATIVADAWRWHRDHPDGYGS